MFHPMNMVKLLQQEIIKMGDQMKHKVILMKMVSTMSELNHNSTMEKVVRSTLHKLMIVIFQSIMTMMMMMMMVLSKDQLKCRILECINPFNGIIPLMTYWGAFDEG